mgnify:FL=1
MRHVVKRLLLTLLGVLVTGGLAPAVASAVPIPGGGDVPVPGIDGGGLTDALGIDVGDLVTKVIKAIVGLVLPDFASHWASQLVTWLVAIPDMSNPATYGSLVHFQHSLLAVGWGLLAITFTAGALQLWASGLGAGQFNMHQAVGRTVVAALMLVFYPTVMRLVIYGVNLFTAQAINSHAVHQGLDKALGSAIVMTAVTSGLTLGLSAGAALFVAYFLAAIILMKIALSAVLAILLLAGALAWGLHPLPATAWLARAWTGALVGVCAIPVAWALIFTAFALLTDTSLHWASGPSSSGAAPGWLENVIKPLVAVACLYAAYKAPRLMLRGINMAGVSPGRMLGPGTSGGGMRGRAAGGGGMQAGGAGKPKRGVLTAPERFAAVRHHAGRAATTKANSVLAKTKTDKRLPTPTPPKGNKYVKPPKPTAKQAGIILPSEAANTRRRQERAAKRAAPRTGKPGLLGAVGLRSKSARPATAKSSPQAKPSTGKPKTARSGITSRRPGPGVLTRPAAKTPAANGSANGKGGRPPKPTNPTRNTNGNGNGAARGAGKAAGSGKAKAPRPTTPRNATKPAGGRGGKSTGRAAAGGRPRRTGTPITVKRAPAAPPVKKSSSRTTSRGARTSPTPPAASPPVRAPRRSNQ